MALLIVFRATYARESQFRVLPPSPFLTQKYFPAMDVRKPRLRAGNNCGFWLKEMVFTRPSVSDKAKVPFC